MSEQELLALNDAPDGNFEAEERGVPSPVAVEVPEQRVLPGDQEQEANLRKAEVTPIPLGSPETFEPGASSQSVLPDSGRVPAEESYLYKDCESLEDGLRAYARNCVSRGTGLGKNSQPSWNQFQTMYSKLFKTLPSSGAPSPGAAKEVHQDVFAERRHGVGSFWWNRHNGRGG